MLKCIQCSISTNMVKDVFIDYRLFLNYSDWHQPVLDPFTLYFIFFLGLLHAVPSCQAILPRDLPDPGVEPASLSLLHWQSGSWPSLIQFSSVSESCLTLWDSVDCRTPGLPVHHQLPEFTQTHVCCCQWCHPTISSSVVPFSSCLQSVLHQGLFKWVNSSHQWPKYWSFSFSINPSNEYSGLISFTMDWLDLLAVQETLKSLLQHHSSKASILQCSAFFIVLTLISIHDYWEKP